MNALIAHGLVRELYYGKQILVVTPAAVNTHAVFEELVSTYHEDAPRYGWGDLDKSVSMLAGYQMHKGEGFVAVRTTYQLKGAWRGRTFDYIVLNRVGLDNPALDDVQPCILRGDPGRVISEW